MASYPHEKRALLHIDECNTGDRIWCGQMRVSAAKEVKKRDDK